MNRRSFLSRLGITAAVAAVLPHISLSKPVTGKAWGRKMARAIWENTRWEYVTRGPIPFYPKALIRHGTFKELPNQSTYQVYEILSYIPVKDSFGETYYTLITEKMRFITDQAWWHDRNMAQVNFEHRAKLAMENMKVDPNLTYPMNPWGPVFFKRK